MTWTQTKSNRTLDRENVFFEDENFVHAYFECALWSSVTDDGEPMDTDYDVGSIALSVWDEGISDIDQALTLADKIEGFDLEDYGYTQFAHDLWLTRNGHGAGFWDRTDLASKEVLDKLTAIAEGMGSKDLYVGDDGTVYAM